jgi:hypothetical protein
MLVPRELLGSLVFLGVETADGFHTAGVAYFVTVPGKAHVYLVTAGHAPSATARTSSPASMR